MSHLQDFRTKLGYHFIDKDGGIYLVRCHVCGRENYAPCVASGRCAWCGEGPGLPTNEAEVVRPKPNDPQAHEDTP